MHLAHDFVVVSEDGRTPVGDPRQTTVVVTFSVWTGLCQKDTNNYDCRETGSAKLKPGVKKPSSEEGA